MASRIQTRSAVLFAATLAVAMVGVEACGSSTLPEPVITSVSPAPWGWVDEDTVVVVTGENFATGITPDAGDPDASKVDRPVVLLEFGNELPILVEGTFLSPTRFEGIIRATVGIPPARYDVHVVNPDGKSAVRSEGLWMRGPATTVVIPSADEIDGNANQVPLDVVLVDAGDNPAPLRASTGDLTATVELTGSATSSGPLVIAAGTSSGSLIINDSVAEAVTVSLNQSDLDAHGLGQSSGQVTFVAGTASAVVLVPASEANAADNFVSTVFRVEDVDGNLVSEHLDVALGLDLVGPCGPGASSDPISPMIPNGTDVFPIEFTCATGLDDITVNVFDDSQVPTGYGMSVNVIMDFF